jgi:hypothetical protein
MTTCAVCGEPLIQPVRGRPRLFCRPACRQAAHELRAWACRAAPLFAESWRAIGNMAVADQILEEARLVQEGRYREALALRRAAHDREREELAAAYGRRGKR